MGEFYLEDPTTRQMEKFLDLSIQRQALVSSNLANVDTPGYKTVDLNFERELREASEGREISVVATNPRHIGSGPAHAPEGQGAHARELALGPGPLGAQDLF